MKLALMLMAGSAFVFVGLLGLYFNGTFGSSSTFDLLQIAQMHIPAEVQKVFFPFLFIGFGIFWSLVSFSYMGT